MSIIKFVMVFVGLLINSVPDNRKGLIWEFLKVFQFAHLSLRFKIIATVLKLQSIMFLPMSGRSWMWILVVNCLDSRLRKAFFAIIIIMTQQLQLKLFILFDKWAHEPHNHYKLITHIQITNDIIRNYNTQYFELT